jgi:hypothetical protein
MTTITEGLELPELDVPLTASVIVAGAIASRDFMPVHHDKAFANAQGAPDIFMNILTTNGYVSRFVTDWAGPDAMVRKIAIRLGVPAIPGGSLHFTGRVAAVTVADGEQTVEVDIRGATNLGDHVTGRVTLTLPA